MDQSTQNVQPQNTLPPVGPIPPSKTQSFKKFIGIMVVIAVVFLLLIGIGAILLKWYSTRTQQPLPARPLTPIPTPTPIALPCPSVAEFCSNAKELTKNNTYQGLGALIERGSPLYAVFDGKVETRSVILGPKAGGGTFSHVSIVNDNLKMIAVYLYNGKTPWQYEIKQGEIIASSSADIPGFAGTNFIFALNDKTG